MRTIVYVDGINLYYGLLKGTPFKWLDLRALCAKLLPRNELIRVKVKQRLARSDQCLVPQGCAWRATGPSSAVR